jgi:hypothetical protein
VQSLEEFPRLCSSNSTLRRYQYVRDLSSVNIHGHNRFVHGMIIFSSRRLLENEHKAILQGLIHLTADYHCFFFAMLVMFYTTTKGKFQKICTILQTDPALLIRMVIRFLPALLLIIALNLLCAAFWLIVALRNELLLSRTLCRTLEGNSFWAARCLRSLLDRWWYAHCFVEQAPEAVVMTRRWLLW